MKAYSLKKQVINAIQWYPGVEVPGGLESPSGDVFLHTVAGKLPLWPGCYVVTGIPGGTAVMSAETFEAAYEAVEEPKAAKPKAAKPKVAKKKVAKKKATKK